MSRPSTANGDNTISSLGAGASRQAHLSSVTLSERSIILLALVRIFLGFLWFQQLSWKMPPTFGGLHDEVEREALHTILPGYSNIISNVFLTHFSVLSAGVWTAELLISICLLFGLFTRLGALLALLLSVQLYFGIAYAPEEWYWSYGMLVLLSICMLAVPAGRMLGLDQFLWPRLTRAAQTNRPARLLAWLV